MGDKLLILDTSQVISGITVLFSFFLGYKYALKRNNTTDEKKKNEEGASGFSKQNAGGDDGWLFSSLSNNYKMVLVVRNDLKMGRGKIAAQCGHGAVGAYQTAMKRSPQIVRAWENSGCAKIALKVESEKEMMVLKRAADAKNLCTCLIRDAGRTQIEPNSKTVLAIGPAAVQDIDVVTGHLKLL